MIVRTLEHTIHQKLHKGKALIITGARQVGKTTLVKNLLKKYEPQALYLNCDEPDIRKNLTDATSSYLKKIIGDKTFLVIDEAQRIPNAGLTLKLITDEIPDVQLVVTGSSTLEMADRTQEALTGRTFQYHLYPLAFQELVDHHGLLEEKRLLHQRLLFGGYPDVVNNPGDAKEILQNLSDSYLFKDLFTMQKIRKPDALQYLLEALSLQVAQQVSYNELAQVTGTDVVTVSRYLDLLEKTFVIFRLRSFSRNVRNELKKSRKIYFWDNGIRNAVINNFSAVELRQDAGALWENYIVSERFKRNMYAGNFASSKFWRTKQQQEIDYLEEADGNISAFEIKWNRKARAKWPKTFTENYPVKDLNLITPDNYEEVLLK